MERLEQAVQLGARVHIPRPARVGTGGTRDSPGPGGVVAPGRNDQASWIATRRRRPGRPAFGAPGLAAEETVLGIRGIGRAREHVENADCRLAGLCRSVRSRHERTCRRPPSWESQLTPGITQRLARDSAPSNPNRPTIRWFAPAWAWVPLSPAAAHPGGPTPPGLGRRPSHTEQVRRLAGQDSGRRRAALGAESPCSGTHAEVDGKPGTRIMPSLPSCRSLRRSGRAATTHSGGRDPQTRRIR